MLRFLKNLFISIAAFIVAAIICCIAVVTLIAVAFSDFAAESEPLKKGTLLEINLNESFVDSPSSPTLADLRWLAFGESAQISTLSMLQSLELAASDPHITAISLRLDGANSIPLAQAEELRAALQNFREVSAKPIYAYAESYSQSEYYLASVADKIYLHPLGQVEWQGIAMNMMFYGDLLQRMGVGVEVFRPEACRYKSAVEPYSRSSMSDESREQSRRLVDELWRGVVGQVAESRKLTPDLLQSVAEDEIVVEAIAARDRGMIDVVGYEEEYAAALESAGVVLKEGAPRRVTLANYAMQLVDNEMSSDNKIAVIYIDGAIVDGASDDGGAMSDGYVGSSTVVRQLREARFDDDVKGVILRVNSPGGSAMAADVMWREVELLKAEKMVVVSMGSYAASGGYYVSAPADAILADRYTITGSIGVYGMMMSYDEALKNILHINIDGVGSAPSADFGRSPRAVTPLERAAVMRGVDQVYESFTTKVSQGRNLPIGVVMALSGGQVWSGTEAASCGLVDGVGGLTMAVGLLADRCGLSSGEFQVVEITTAPDEFTQLLTSLGASVSSAFGGNLTIAPLLSLLTPERTQIERDIRMLDSSNGLLTHSPLQISF